MSVYTIQPSFSGGEFSPSLYSRIDVQKYSTGLKTLKNFIVHSHGGASNRPGFEYVCEGAAVFGELGENIRLIPFEYSVTQAYALEFGHNYIRVIQDGGLVLNAGFETIFSLATTYTSSQIYDIKYTQSADVLYLYHPEHPPRILTRYASNAWTIADVAIVGGPFLSEQHTSVLTVTSPGITPPLGLMLKDCPTRIVTSVGNEFFKLGHIGSLVKINQFKQSGSLSQTITADIATPVSSIIVKGTWRITTSGTWAGVMTVLRSKPNSYTEWEVVKTLNHNVSTFSNYDIYGEEDDICRMGIGMSAWGGGTCYVDVSCDSFAQSGVVKITDWIDAYTVDGVIVSPFMKLDSILSWQEGSWSTKRGFPSCGAFYQDRMVVGGTPTEPQTIWASKIGNYLDFGTSSPLQDTDAISVNLPSRKMNSIKNLVALSEVLALTSGSECSVGDSGGVFSPTTVKTKVHGYRGSSEVTPVTVGNRTLAVQSMGSVVRDYGYDFSSDSFTGGDLSIFSTHLFKGFTVKEMAYQQEPDSLVWCVRSDGKLLSMTYMKEQDVVAWTHHETDGLFESVCSIPGDGQNDVYVVVNRAGKRFVERLAKRLPVIDSEEAFFLDSGLTYRGAATLTISGLTHLNGRTVTALANGRVVKNLLVTAGVITLPVAATIVHVGLPYVSDFETLNIQVPMQDGTGYGRLIKVAESRFTFLNSRGGFIGPDANSLDEIIELSSTILSDPKELFSGEYRQTMASGYEAGGGVFFRQSDPLPVTILSVMPKITVGG